MEDTKLVLTGSGLLEFLNEIEELKDKSLELIEMDGKLNVSIGDTTYSLECAEDSTVEAPEEVVDSIDEIDESGYDEFAETIEEEDIEGGIIKELIKTLAVGGLVRLTKDAIANS